jgi:uncharacterized Zn-binding protein involved in type VI secretion
MPPASRIWDIGMGHECFPPTPVIEGSPNVKVCSIPQERVGDALMPHPCPTPAPPHPRSSSEGSTTVITNSKGSSRIGDAVDCGGFMVNGCGTVIMGG